MLWVAVTLVLVLVVRYFTAINVKHLEGRLLKAKEEIEASKLKLKLAKDKQTAAKEQEKILRSRVEHLQALIQDMESEITMPRRSEEEEKTS